MPCGERCCCILGGCGCPPGGVRQKEALAGLIMKHMGGTASSALKAAEEIFDIFGYGPHKQRLAELGVSQDLIDQKEG